MLLNLFQMLQEMSQMSDPKMLEQCVKDYNDRIQDLWDKLMCLELQVVDQLEVTRIPYQESKL